MVATNRRFAAEASVASQRTMLLSPWNVMPAASSDAEGVPQKGKHRLWPASPLINFAS